MRKYNALVRVWQDEQYRLDRRTALIQLDLRNIWAVGDSHPNAWELEEILAPRDGAPRKGSQSVIDAWLAARPEPTPERIAYWKALQVKSAVAIATRKWTGPEVFPMPS